ncbi:MAG: hypothetical protein ACXVCX_00470 [Ktedonobacterales bacterium]
MHTVPEYSGVWLSHDDCTRIIPEEEVEWLLALVGGEAQTRGFQFDMGV